ncbi:hypothetical protein M231_01618 [Tremella mesenterica]|uniref:Uncharacterized protein n=1 Tax=Tremella mesenterica TaxID=5217 RepID=A0A4Q1BT33_TREME|nr:hypothetical protein M231_01618 [Tremella mesenterica]
MIQSINGDTQDCPPLTTYRSRLKVVRKRATQSQRRRQGSLSLADGGEFERIFRKSLKEWAVCYSESIFATSTGTLQCTNNAGATEIVQEGESRTPEETAAVSEDPPPARGSAVKKKNKRRRKTTKDVSKPSDIANTTEKGQVESLGSKPPDSVPVAGREIVTCQSKPQDRSASHQMFSKTCEHKANHVVHHIKGSCVPTATPRRTVRLSAWFNDDRYDGGSYATLNTTSEMAQGAVAMDLLECIREKVLSPTPADSEEFETKLIQTCSSYIQTWTEKESTSMTANVKIYTTKPPPEYQPTGTVNSSAKVGLMLGVGVCSDGPIAYLFNPDVHPEASEIFVAAVHQARIAPGSKAFSLVISNTISYMEGFAAKRVLGAVSFEIHQRGLRHLGVDLLDPMLSGLMLSKLQSQMPQDTKQLVLTQEGRCSFKAARDILQEGQLASSPGIFVEIA